MILNFGSFSEIFRYVYVFCKKTVNKFILDVFIKSLGINVKRE